MTASTEQERAEFEAAYVAEKLRIMGSEGSADGEKAIRAIMLRRNANGDYDNSLEAHFAWWAWQAARRAQVVPQGYESGAMSGNRVTLFFDNQKNAESWFDGFCDGYDASAPQPPEAESLMSEIRTSKPEAAPVQLQESISKVLEDCRSRAIDYATCPSPYNNTRMETAFQSLEHQVRQLLAAQQFTLDELAMLTRKLVQRLRKASPGDESAEKALDYLKRKGLAGNPLRATQEQRT